MASLHTSHPPDPPPYEDIRILLTINEGIAHISDRRIRDSLAKAVQTAARSVTLPKGVELGDNVFKAQTQG